MTGHLVFIPSLLLYAIDCMVIIFPFCTFVNGEYVYFYPYICLFFMMNGLFRPYFPLPPFRLYLAFWAAWWAFRQLGQ